MNMADLKLPKSNDNDNDMANLMAAFTAPIPVFDGTTPVEDWINTFCRHIQTIPSVTDQQACALLLKSVKGAARGVVQGLKIDAAINDYLEALREAFEPSDPYNAFQQILDSFHQKDKETVRVYNTRMRQLLTKYEKKVGHALPPPAQLTTYVRGLRPELRAKVFGQAPADLDKACEWALAYEKAQSQSNIINYSTATVNTMLTQQRGEQQLTELTDLIKELKDELKELREKTEGTGWSDRYTQYQSNARNNDYGRRNRPAMNGYKSNRYNNNNNNNSRTPRCFRCQRLGHIARNCLAEETTRADNRMGNPMGGGRRVNSYNNNRIPTQTTQYRRGPSRRNQWSQCTHCGGNHETHKCQTRIRNMQLQRAPDNNNCNMVWQSNVQDTMTDTMENTTQNWTLEDSYIDGFSEIDYNTYEHNQIDDMLHTVNMVMEDEHKRPAKDSSLFYESASSTTEVDFTCMETDALANPPPTYSDNSDNSIDEKKEVILLHTNTKVRQDISMASNIAQVHHTNTHRSERQLAKVKIHIESMEAVALLDSGATTSLITRKQLHSVIHQEMREIHVYNTAAQRICYGNGDATVTSDAVDLWVGFGKIKIKVAFRVIDTLSVPILLGMNTLAALMSVSKLIWTNEGITLPTYGVEIPFVHTKTYSSTTHMYIPEDKCPQTARHLDETVEPVNTATKAQWMTDMGDMQPTKDSIVPAFIPPQVNGELPTVQQGHYYNSMGKYSPPNWTNSTKYRYTCNIRGAGYVKSHDNPLK